MFIISEPKHQESETSQGLFLFEQISKDLRRLMALVIIQKFITLYVSEMPKVRIDFLLLIFTRQ